MTDRTYIIGCVDPLESKRNIDGEWICIFWDIGVRLLQVSLLLLLCPLLAFFVCYSSAPSKLLEHVIKVLTWATDPLDLYLYVPLYSKDSIIVWVGRGSCSLVTGLTPLLSAIRSAMASSSFTNIHRGDWQSFAGVYVLSVLRRIILIRLTYLSD